MKSVDKKGQRVADKKAAATKSKKGAQKYGTPFQQKVWKEITRIPCGHTITYAQLAQCIGRPRAVRAVANAVGANPRPIEVPCHRVVRSDGTLGGYSGPGGVEGKRKLLAKEGVNLV